MSDFVHLHCHTEYSLLDGAIRIKDLCARTVELGLPAAAITDHGNLFGALNFYLTAREYGIKPIIGCEVYVAMTDRHDKSAKSASQAGYHLILLAQNREGYHNLLQLVSAGNLEGFHYKPRVDKELLARWNPGLIALSACLKGEVPYKLRNQGFDAGLAAAREYAALFPDRFYLELQANGLEEQLELNDKLLELAGETGLQCVATNDCHYLGADDVEAHDLLLCIQTNACVDDERRMRFNTRELYYRPPSEMEAAFAHCPEIVGNTMEVAKRCNLELELGKHRFPLYEVPEGLTLEEEFRRLAEEGLKERTASFDYEIDEKVYQDRLQEELGIICSKGFPGYFLIVQDFINWAKRRGIPVGPGRGSAAGSLVAYSLKITNLDPIRYRLLFERFLNVERESLPDIDVDFCYNRREEVIRYVTEKYGKDSVAQITTFGTMKARAVVRDVGRALGMSFAETDKIAKLIPEELKMTIDKALEQEPELKQRVADDPTVSRLIDTSRRLEGLARHASTHAAGIVISDRPMKEYLPLYRGKRGEVVTQYDMKKVEKVGLIKFDFLGLKTLTVIQDTLDLAAANDKDVPDLDSLPLDDEKTYALLARGQTDGVFQLESSGMRRVLMDLRPTCFEDIIALLALYRPGPLESGMVDDFIKRKHGLVDVRYDHPKLEPILNTTYGVILYQEQVMRIASDLASYSLGDGDILRRAMGKKDPAVMAEQRSKFMQGAQDNGIPGETAAHIFDLMEKFAGYGFNKSHSAAYALVSYQTAYLKAHFPTEFMAALITSDVNNTDKVIAYVNACRDMGIVVLPPDVNKSFRSFTVEGEKIRFGLSGIKNVGTGAIQAMVEERTANGPYASLLDLCQRVSLRKVTKRVLESLIKSGALDTLGCTRAALLASLEKVAGVAQKQQQDKNRGQLSLIQMMGGTSCTMPGIGLNLEEGGVREWGDEDRLRFEKDALGFYLSGHPLLRYREELLRLNLHTLKQCSGYSPGSEVKVALVVSGRKEHVTKKGGKMAFCQVEDLSGSGELILFPEVYAKIRPDIEDERPLLVTARIAEQEGDDEGNGDSGEDGARKAKLIALEGQRLEETAMMTNAPVCLTLTVEDLPDNPWESLRRIVQRYPGGVALNIRLFLQDAECLMQLGHEYSVAPSPDFWDDIRHWQKPGPAGPEGRPAYNRIPV